MVTIRKYSTAKILRLALCLAFIAAAFFLLSRPKQSAKPEAPGTLDSSATNADSSSIAETAEKSADASSVTLASTSETTPSDSSVSPELKWVEDYNQAMQQSAEPEAPGTLDSSATNADSSSIAETAEKSADASSVTLASTSETTPSDSSVSPELKWVEDYNQAMQQAVEEKRLMLVHFYRRSDQRRAEAAEAGDSVVNIEAAVNQPGVREKLAGYVLTKLPLDAQANAKGEKVRLLDHGAYSELHKGPGLAVIDLAHEGTEYYGYVVSILRFTPGKYYRFNPKQLETLVNLPAGTLTQRSMVFAVRIHPEHPASTEGQENPVLLSEATDHSDYQARIHVQGHQDWGSRFHRILGKLLGRGERGMPVEVVAESWPDQDLMDSCVDCVASWRQSEGHWNEVKAQQASYGYDIREGSNGIWYATGIFREAQ